MYNAVRSKAIYQYFQNFDQSCFFSLIQFHNANVFWRFWKFWHSPVSSLVNECMSSSGTLQQVFGVCS